MDAFGRKILYAAYCVLTFSQIFSFRVSGRAGFPAEREVYLDPAALVRVGVVVGIALLLVILYRARALPSLRDLQLSAGLKVVGVLIAVFAVSTLWSPLPSTAAFRVLQLLTSTVLVFSLVLAWREDAATDVFWRLSVPVFVSGVLNGLLAPGGAVLQELGHIGYLHRFKENAGGHIAALAAVSCSILLIWKPGHTSYRQIVARLGVCLVALVMFRSASGWILLQLGLLAVLVRGGFVLTLIAGAWLGLASLFFIDVTSVLDLGLLGQGTTKMASLGNRTALYDLTLPLALESPWWGYGFLADSTLRQFSDLLGWTPVNAHNGYLSALLNCGALGPILVVAAFLAGYLQLGEIRRAPFPSPRAICVFQFRLVLILIAIGNGVESWVGDKFTLIWPLFIAAIVLPLLLARDDEEALA